jgi:hypothetical protein
VIEMDCSGRHRALQLSGPSVTCTNDAVYRDVVPGRRIVIAYT